MFKTTIFSIAAVASCGFGCNTLASDDVKDLIAVDKRQQHAYVERDWEALGDILTDDYVLVLWNGAERSKAQILKNANSPSTVWEVNESSDWNVRVLGDTGIVVAQLHQKGTSEGQPFDSIVKFSDTYVRINGQWKNLHAHASKAVNTVPKQQ